jgi:hypothetical protein
MLLAPIGSDHTGLNFNYQSAPVSSAAFTTTFTFVPNGWNLSLVLNNNTITSQGGPPAAFASGAGCEASFYQGFGGTPPPQLTPNNDFALLLDSWQALTDANGDAGGVFTYSSAQIYQQWQDPCNPAYTPDEVGYYMTQRVSTSPVSLNSPANSARTTTGDTYSATVTYTGTTLTLNMFNVTAGGTCSPVTSGSCFSYSWQNLSIPTWVKGTTAYVGLASGNDGVPATTYPLYINSWTYTNLSAAATPTFSSGTGPDSGTQSVTISDLSPGTVICYNTTGAPATNGIGGCASGTHYTGAISVSSGETIYAVAGTGTSSYGDSAVGSAAYRIGSTASQPTFSPSQGVYDGDQTVVLTTAHGGVICYNTTGSPATNGSTGCTTGTLYSTPITVSSNETLYAVAGGAGSADSGVGSAAYTISPYWGGTKTSPLPANTPAFSPPPGTYSGTQTVSLSSTTSGTYICYLLASTSTPPTILPYPDSVGGCSTGTLYSTPVSVSSNQILYAVTGANNGGLTTTPGLALAPSSPAEGTYTINSGSQGQAPGAPMNVQSAAKPQ